MNNRNLFSNLIRAEYKCGYKSYTELFMKTESSEAPINIRAKTSQRDLGTPCINITYRRCP